MKLQTEYENRGKYLLVSAWGELTLESGEVLIEEIRREAERRKMTRVLLFAWEMLLPGRDFIKFKLGIHMGQIWGHSLKVAELGRGELIDSLIENAAVNSGAWFKVFSDERLALHWLLRE